MGESGPVWIEEIESIASELAIIMEILAKDQTRQFMVGFRVRVRVRIRIRIRVRVRGNNRVSRVRVVLRRRG